MRLSLLIVAMGVGLFASSAAAQTHGRQEELADAAFVEGRRLLNEGNLEKACERLEESDRLSASGRAVINLAECLERRGMLASAYARFLETARRASLAGLTEVERHARERAASLEPRVPRLRFVMRPASDAAGVVVLRDGKTLPRESFDRADPFDPGTAHTFEATAPEHSPFRTSVVAREGTTLDVELVWSGVHGPTAVPVARSVEGASPSPSPLRWWLLGGGGALAIVGTVAGLQVLSAKNTVASRCEASTRSCDDEGIDAAGRGATYEVIAPLTFVASALAVAASAYLFFSASPSRKVAR